MEKKRFILLCILCLLIVFVLANAGFVSGAGDDAEKEAEKKFVDKFKELVDSINSKTLTSEQVKGLMREELEQALDKGLINEVQRKELIDEMGLYQYLKNKVLDYGDKGRAYLKSQLGWVRVGERGTKWPIFNFVVYIPFLVSLYLFLIAFYPFSTYVYANGKKAGDKVSFADLANPKIDKMSAYEFACRTAGRNSFFDKLKHIRHDYKDVFKLYFLRLNNWRLYFSIAFPLILWISMIFPVLNRVVQVITFDVLGVPFVFRALIIAVIFSYLPSIFAGYIRHRRAMIAYEEGLRKQYIVEKAKVEVG